MVAICRALDVREAIIVGHSAGAMIALLAAIRAPQYFAKAVLLAASPYYLNEPGYYGGFERKDVADLLATMDANYQQWANAFAIMLVGQDYPATLGYELAGYFCQSDPEIAKQIVQLSFWGDNRALLPQLHLPTLLLQCADDVAVPTEVGQYLLEHLPQATLVTLQATGHCPHLSAPREVLAAMQDFIG
ncbi:alpha/beta fold hydrolase [Hymenobacter sp. HMF4947]|uniref:Alpha/beta fold hydrolase n=1 Tax=Hymenobacter ginkgonis TaxID=2682976 RepID=A0A7K1T968_9BACT|nr:alpha/beta hydrolase [Hymenobacter ginkgonis]MVN74954.1 alpha/beta fold hydrolase [Hymenobacter ginkgonis]